LSTPAHERCCETLHPVYAGDVPKHPVSEWMKAERNKRGWKQTDVAARLRAAGHEAEDGTYRVWETGRPPKRSTIQALERLYETAAPSDDAETDLSALVARLERQAEVIDRLAAAVEVLALGQDAMLKGFLEGLAELRREPAADPASPSHAGTRG